MNNLAVDKTENFSFEIEKCHAEIVDHQSEIKRLEASVDVNDSELQSIAVEKQKYDLLDGICDSLDQLSDLGGGSLFWDGISPQEQVSDHLKRIRELSTFFYRRTQKITDKLGVIHKEIDEHRRQISLLADDILTLEEREEESQNEYLVIREINEIPYRVVVMPWAQEKKDTKRIRKTLLLVLLLTIIAGIAIPIIDFPISDRDKPVKIPERLAKMLKKQKQKPKPKQKVKKKVVEEKKLKEKTKPTKKEREKARKKVQSKGVLAFKNNLADLLEDMPEAKLGAQASLNNAGSTARTTRRSILTSQATTSSGGINTSALSRNVAGTGSDLAAVSFSHVSSAIGDAVAEDRPLSDGPGPSRTDEEIQIVFDKYKAALYRIYNRELRKNPTLMGKIVLRMTIDPNGRVSSCKIESTDMDAKILLDKIVQRVKRFNFGDKPDVPPVTILYPIDFLPAS